MDQELERALASLLGPARTGDLLVDLKAAFEECLNRRENNTRDGGAIIWAMRAKLGWTWRTFTMQTGESPRTGARWIDKVVRLARGIVR